MPSPDWRNIPGQPIECGGRGVLNADFGRDVGCHVTHSVAQPVGSGGFGAILAMDMEYYDTDGMHDLVVNNSRLTFQRAGKFGVGLGAEWANTIILAGIVSIAILKNGVTVLDSVKHSPSPVGTPTIQNAKGEDDFLIGDFVQAFMFQTTGVALNINAVVRYSPKFTGRKIDRGGMKTPLDLPSGVMPTTDLPFDKACHAARLFDEIVNAGWTPYPQANADFFGITTAKKNPQTVIHIYDGASQADKDAIASIVDDHSGAVRTTDLPFNKACDAARLFNEIVAAGWTPYPQVNADFFGITTAKENPQTVIHIYDAASKAHKDEITSIVSKHKP